MSERSTGKVRTVSVMGSEPMVRADGRAAIRLDTRELGPIAFEVNQRAIDSLRQAIAAAETHLRQSKDQTPN
jgi:hypothetical protein